MGFNSGVKGLNEGEEEWAKPWFNSRNVFHKTFTLL